MTKKASRLEIETLCLNKPFAKKAEENKNDDDEGGGGKTERRKPIQYNAYVYCII